MTSTNTETMTTKFLQRLARMEISGIARNEISRILNLSESRLSQIIDSEEYKSLESQISAEHFEQMQLINRGWDSVEAIGLQQVIQTLQHSQDPEFALKAASLANKAARRGGFQNQPISQNAGSKVIVNLNSTFVDKLQQNFQITESESKNVVIEQKVTNVMNAKGVQELLGIKDDVHSEVEKHLNNAAQQTFGTQDSDDAVPSTTLADLLLQQKPKY